MIKLWSLDQQPSITWELLKNADLLDQNPHFHKIPVGFAGNLQVWEVLAPGLETGCGLLCISSRHQRGNQEDPPTLFL